VRLVQRVLVERLDADEQARTARPDCEAEQILVTGGEIERGLAAPLDPERNERLEQFVGVLPTRSAGSFRSTGSNSSSTMRMSSK